MDDLTEKSRYNLLEKEIKFRRLAIRELDPEMLLPFQRYQEVNRVWRVIDGERKLVSEPFVDNWDEETKAEIIEQDFKHCLLGGGSVICAEDNGKVVGFSSLIRQLFGSRSQYADLMQLHVSADYRGKGLGKALFAECARQAKAWGAGKLYISAHSAEETVAFYRAVGCVDALEINKEHVEREPFDCQLEYVLNEG
jgi:ribosomal protein S18 acetylase RimI-like enzyme